MSDANRLRQVVRNLLGNANAYGVGSPTVRDGGIGIETEYQEQLFEVFRRLTTDRGYSGT